MWDDEFRFGPSNADGEDPESLKELHVHLDVDQTLKWRAEKSGKQIVVGIKGSGKTALRRYVELSDDRAHTLALNADTGVMNIDASSIKGRSGNLKNVLALQLLRAYSQHVGGQGRGGKVRTALSSAYERGTEIIKNVPDALEAEIAGINVNFSRLLAAPAAAFVTEAWNALVDDIVKALKDTRGYITIDDAEDIFRGFEGNPAFIEGLARAVSDINARTENRLHVLLFLKQGIWRIWYDDQREYDKVRQLVAFQAWDVDLLAQLIAKRISAKHGVAWDGDVEQAWRREFDWTGDFGEFYSWIASYCVSGPRDMVDLCNLAGAQLPGDRITSDAIEAVLGAYSADRFNQIGSDFGDVYPDIHHFAEKVMRSVNNSTPGGGRVSETIDSLMVQDESVAERYEGLDWFKKGTPRSLLLKFYEIGLLGVKDGDSVAFAVDRPRMTAEDLEQGQCVVHQAFRPYLSLST